MVKRSQRLVAMFAAIIILFEVAAVPQKAKAVALSASVIASVVAIMTACGVSYWASTQQDAIDYVGGKIDDYFSSLETVPVSYEDWLGINAPSELFEVVSGGVMQFGSGVANKILDFVRWFNEEEGVFSGGDPVGILGSLSVAGTFKPSSSVRGSVSAQLVGSDTIRLTYDGARYPDSNLGVEFCVLFSGNFDGPVTVRILANGESRSMVIGFIGTGQNGISQGRSIFTTSATDGAEATTSAGPLATTPYFAIGIRTPGKYADPYSGSIDFQFVSGASGVVQDPEVAITPSVAVSVPSELPDNDVLMVTPSVNLTEGMTVEDASAEIYDGVTSEDGLTSTAEATEPPSIDLSGILEALGSILNAILSIPSHIANGVQSIVTTLGEKVDSFKDAVRGFLTTFDNYLYDIRQTLTEMAHDVSMLISDRLEYLFVPDEVYVQNYVQSITHLFDGRVGILTFPLSVFVDFLTRFSSISDGDHSFHWGNINEPFSGKQVIAAGSYNLDDAVASSPMSTVYSVYLVVVKAVIAFWFLRLCQRKYELIVNGH